MYNRRRDLEPPGDLGDAEKEGCLQEEAFEKGHDSQLAEAFCRARVEEIRQEEVRFQEKVSLQEEVGFQEKDLQEEEHKQEEGIEGG